jgi:amino acid transporter
MTRSLTLPAIVAIIFFNVAGGPYALEEIIAAGPGLALLLLLLTPLVWSTPVALVCAELGTAIPEEGGYYAWAKRALGPFGAYCQGWWAWLYTLIDIGLYPTMFCLYAAYFWPELGPDGDPLLRRTVMVAMIWGFVLLNLRGARTVGRFAEVFVAAVLLPFVIMVGVGLYRIFTTGAGFSPVMPLVAPGTTLPAALAAAVPIVMWNYLGWDAISTIAGEMENPRRNYPRALAIAVGVIVLTYVAPVLVALCLVGTPIQQAGGVVEWTTGAWSIAAEQIVAPWLGTLVAAMGMVSAVGLYAALVLVYSRVPFVMSFDGYLPRRLTHTNARGAPYVSLIASGLVYTGVVVYFDDFESLAVADVTMYAAMVSLELLTFLALRWREPELARPFHIHGGWPVAILVCALPWAFVGLAAYYRVLEDGVFEVLGKAGLIMLAPLLAYPFITAWQRRGQRA